MAGPRSRPFSSRGRSLVTLLMMLSAAVLVFLIFTIIGTPTTNDDSVQSGGATIALQNPQRSSRTSFNKFFDTQFKRPVLVPPLLTVGLCKKDYFFTYFLPFGKTRLLLIKLEDEESRPRVELLSWEPRAFVYHNMLTNVECDHLIKLARPNMVKSTVVDSATGRSKDSRVRTSSGTFLNRGQDEIIKGIERKIAEFTFIPVEHGEGLQVLHYEVGQKYEAHYDYFHDAFNTQNGGQRIATVLMYLSDVEAGGETVFPTAKANNRTVNWEAQSVCAQAGLAVRPKRGMALLFWSLGPDAQKDASSLHGGCPVIQGNKWSATKWLHINKYSVPS